MPDKQNENKFMAMLERKGIVSRVDSEDKQTTSNVEAGEARPKDDLSSMFGHPKVDNNSDTKATSRQPVPGMINPKLPTETKQPADNRYDSRTTERVVPLQGLAPDTQVDEANNSQPKGPEPIETGSINFEQDRPARISNDISKEIFIETPQVETVEPIQVAKQEPILPIKLDSTLPQPQEPAQPERQESVQPEQRGYIPPVQQGSPQPEQRGYTPPVQQGYPQPEQRGYIPPVQQGYPQPERQEYTPPEQQARVAPVQNTLERYLNVDEIYASLSLHSKGTDTIYLVEEYMKTLPASLPEESRREIVEKIISASDFNYDMLMGDGVLRVKMIKDYAEKFARYTEEYVSGENEELAELERQVQRVKTLIENRRELHKKQFFTIEAEAQRLKEILLFISG